MSNPTRPSGKKVRMWQRMLSGRQLNLADPSALDIEINDIARGLSRINRWSGQTTGEHGLSVAQHSVLVTQQLLMLKPKASQALQLACLLHDGAEFVIGDMISPFKRCVGGAYLQTEEHIQQAIHQSFSLPFPLSNHWKNLIKRADRNIAWLEATQLAGFSETEAHKFIAQRPLKLVVESLSAISPNEAEESFLKAFEQLYREC